MLCHRAAADHRLSVRHSGRQCIRRSLLPSISDTTILSSTGAGCQHIEHVSTQLPYALTVASCCFVGYVVAGFSGGNVVLTLASAICVWWWLWWCCISIR